MLFSAACGVAVLGVDVGRSDTHLLLLGALALCFASVLLSWAYPPRGLRAQASAPRRVPVGEALRILVQVHNEGPRPHRDLRTDYLLEIQALSEPPSPLDTYLARRVRLRLDELASSWTAGASSDLEKIEAIEGHLQRDFRYARVVRRDIDLDPVLDFLLRDRSGHCEYFASGLVLLARSVGVPARVVTGYRVAEYNALGGYHVVRERNAHAWVEAWVEGKWVTRDPTPEDPLPQNRPHETGQAAALLRRYEALRYGGQGDPVAIEGAVDAWLRRQGPRASR
jgi:transglutaminase-like putative cysteine protease